MMIRYHSQFSVTKVPTFVFATVFTLFGCGGESSGTTSTATGVDLNAQSATVLAQDAMYSTALSERYEVDLTSNVHSSNGGGFTLTNIEVLSQRSDCQVESMTDSGFTIQATDPKVCSYRYQVSPKASAAMSRQSQDSIAMSNGSGAESMSTAITRVAVSSEPDSTELTPLSAVTLINENITVSLKEELQKVGYELGDQFTLTSSDLSLAYSHGGSVSVDSLDEQSINYTPAQGFTGIDRVMYSLANATGEVLMGVLDIAVGYEANQGFSIDGNIQYPNTIKVSTETDVDISDFVTSEDGDDYQLIYVKTFNAHVTPKAPLDTQNKTITFSAPQPGFHYISFAVSDHNGAYDMGLIRVEVVDPNQSAQWKDIAHLADIYTAPLTVVDAASQGLIYDAKSSDTGYTPAIDMAGLRYATAKAYCESIGAVLPTVTQLTKMTTDKQVQSMHNWPVGKAYLAYDEVVESANWVDLSDNDAIVQTGEISLTEYYYGTCIKQGLITVLPTSSAEVVANGTDVGTVFVELKLGDEIRPNTLVSARVSDSSATLEPETQTTDSQGLAQFELTSVKAKTVTVTFDVGGVTQTHDVKFIGDEQTSGVTSKATINNAEYGSVDGNLVTATLKDDYGNPLEGYSVTSEVSSGEHPDTFETVKPLLVEETTKTDSQGEQKVRLIWDRQYEMPKSSMTFDVTSSYTTTLDKQTGSTSQVTFNGYLCGGQVGDDDGENAAADCIKMVEFNEGDDTYLFTGTPSVKFLKAIDYPVSSSDFKETGTYGPDEGVFARFTNSQANALCTYYNDIELNGKSNWRLPTRNELKKRLYDTYAPTEYDYSAIYEALGWATRYYYWSSTRRETNNGSIYYLVRLYDGSVYGTSPSLQLYASCVSGP
ncbi:Ig-like domain-containing protein [Vibrio sp. BS-M-Sm-2]|uniref:Ig-like domain-containing protein n=1 Tax=Vibrio sp. BS-M-Sm-2 TaxID=3241167 RepID=UPI003557A61E